MVEALTIVLAVGVTRGWRSTLFGVGAALLALAAIIAVLGPSICARCRSTSLQLVVGGLLLVFGLQWLRKAILRASGYMALHDEDGDLRRASATRRARGRPRASAGSTGTRSRSRSRACSSRASRSRSSSSRSAARARAASPRSRPRRRAALLVVVVVGVRRPRAAQPRAREHAEVRGRACCSPRSAPSGRRRARRVAGRADVALARDPGVPRAAPRSASVGRSRRGGGRVRYVVAFPRFWYDFVVGDDWRDRVSVVVAICATAALAITAVTSGGSCRSRSSDSSRSRSSASRAADRECCRRV